MDSEECTICIEPLNEDVTKFGCGHSFHTKCFSQYVASKHPNSELTNVDVECPLCRAHIVITILPEEKQRKCTSLLIAALLPASAISFMMLYLLAFTPKLP